MKPLEEATLAEERFLGGKAVQLGAAIRAGLPVPHGIVLDVAEVAAIASHDPSAMASLRTAIDARFDFSRGVAVRSSAVGEDSANASFAGQHLTVLGVESVDALFEAVAAVRASASTPSALAYRERLGLHGDPAIAVVVQEMVDASCAGVLFTRDPTNGEDVRVIECAWGLGEIVVAGLVIPDRYQVARDGRVLLRHAGVKDFEIVRRGGVTEEVAVDDLRARALCLDDARLARLHDLALRCERAFEGAHDLEFGFNASDTLYLLQRRAITRTGAVGTDEGNRSRPT